MIAIARRTWPVVVLGAGPAGAMTALALAQAGAEVLLLDKARFPRDTACGCCLNGRALAMLGEADLLGPRGPLRPVATRRLRLFTPRRGLVIGLPTGAAVSRRALDAALVEAAGRAGATLLAPVTARLGPVRARRRVIAVRDSGGRTAELGADIVIVADGRAGRSLRDLPGLGWRIDQSAPIGLCTTLPEGTAGPAPGEIVMACGARGYVGLVTLEDRSVRVASAVDARWTRQVGGANAAMGALLREVGLGVPGTLETAAVLGTGRLGGRRRAVTAPRVFVVGDAAGAVQPFTGEGIGRALTAARMVAPLALDAARGWRDAHARAWTAAQRRGPARRSGWDRLVALAVRHPGLLRPLTAALARRPGLAGPILNRLHRGQVSERLS